MSTTKPRQNVKQVDFRNRKRKLKRSRRSKITYGQIGSKVMSDIRDIRRMINVEDKYIDTNVSASFGSTAPVFTLLNGTQLGTTAITRTGQSVRAVSMQMTLYLAQHASATNTLVRAIIFRDEQANSATPGANDLLVTGTDTLSLRYVPNLPRFHTYFDEIMDLTSNNNHSMVFSITLPMSFHVQYNTSNAGTIADISRNSLFLYLQSNEAANFAAYAFNIRFSYVDN